MPSNVLQVMRLIKIKNNLDEIDAATRLVRSTVEDANGSPDLINQVIADFAEWLDVKRKEL